MKSASTAHTAILLLIAIDISFCVFAPVFQRERARSGPK
jgi:hypothetical protein